MYHYRAEKGVEATKLHPALLAQNEDASKEEFSKMGIEWAERQMKRMVSKRLPSDPLFPNQVRIFDRF